MSGTQPPTPDRVIQVAPSRRRLLSTRQIVIATVGIGLVVSVLYFTRNTGTVSKDDNVVMAAASAHIVPWQPKKEEPPPVVQAAPPPIVPVAAQPLIVPPIATPRPATAQESGKPKDTPAVYSYSLPQPSETAVKARADAGAGNGSSGSTHVAFKPVTLPGLQAGPMGGDESLTLARGLIRCVLIDDIVNGGPFQCMLQGPATSPTGVPLMDRGTIITGHTDATLSGGQNRIPGYGVVAETPTHPPCEVPLSGGVAADQLGAAGMPASVDHYYLERFGPAIGLSLTDSLFSLLQSSMQSNSKGNNTYLQFNTGSISSLASEVLRSQMNEYKPTGMGHRGDAITIWVTEPISFKACYKLVAR